MAYQDMNIKEWKYYDREFECDRESGIKGILHRYGPWSGLRDFAYDLVRWADPKIITELGVHAGCSSMAFLQALKDSRSESVFYAVDTWMGDKYTENDYKEDIYGIFESVRGKYYWMTECRTMKMTFRDALACFEEGSIDILHIDGSHSYEDVKEDYENWRDRVGSRGIIMLHDTGDEPFEGKILGSRRLWMEIRAVEENTVEIPYSNGLGIIFRDRKMYEYMAEHVDMEKYKTRLYREYTEAKAKVRELAFILRDPGADGEAS